MISRPATAWVAQPTGIAWTAAPDEGDPGPVGKVGSSRPTASSEATAQRTVNEAVSCAVESPPT